MPLYRVEIRPRDQQVASHAIIRELESAGLRGVRSAIQSSLIFLDAELDRAEVTTITQRLLCDPVTEDAIILAQSDPTPSGSAKQTEVEVHLRPGVMDPTAESTLAELRAEGVSVEGVRTGRRFVFEGDAAPASIFQAVSRVLANDVIEEVVLGSAGMRPMPQPRTPPFTLRRVAIRALSDNELEQLSRRGHLFLSLDEMRAIQAHYREQQREPTDLELETLAQTWSEHCVHKTLKSAVTYRGAPMPTPESLGGALQTPGAPSAPQQPILTRSAAPPPVVLQYGNLLKDTIARATAELISAGRGPECLSVFKDNAGVIRFDEAFGVAFKVETHNRPSAIEPYGGAATGVGGCIRDVVGCGLGAAPIANTDVFCVAPGEIAYEQLPKGVLHPARVLRGVVRGVADYGNRMGIPTVNGAVHFDPRYLGNPLVYCGCVGLIPQHLVEKQVNDNDLIVLIGGRTGRDGIHGATFSSAELTDTHVDEFSHAVQIGNAITEKRMVDALLRARDAAGGCLYSAITDCGAGGLSSAVGEMAQSCGATVELEQVPLKYVGLRYDEIWISEAQERMVLAVPRENWTALQAILREEDVEGTVIGQFGGAAQQAAGGPRLIVRYQGNIVGELAMTFLHDGLPATLRHAEWSATFESSPAAAPRASSAAELLDQLRLQLGRPSIASKAWIVRQYDHEVQGASVIKPFCGPGSGPSDAAVLRPRPQSQRGVAVGCGLAPQLAELDPYWMALSAIDEAVRNVVCVGGDPRQTALLDNFCWGRCDDPRQMGALVRACQGCYDAAIAYGTPFISGKDSLNNEFALAPADVERVIALLRSVERAQAALHGGFRLSAASEARIRSTGRLSIPPTLLISAISLIADVRGCISADLKEAGNTLYLVGGFDPTRFALRDAGRVHEAVSRAIRDGQVRACKDASEGGWLVALAEMALGGVNGVRLEPDAHMLGPFEERVAAYVIEAGREFSAAMSSAAVACRAVAQVTEAGVFEIGGTRATLDELRQAWQPERRA